MTIEELQQLKDLIIWMSGGVVFSSNQAEVFAKGLNLIDAWNRRTPDWISIDERLPEPDAKVLVSCRTKKGQNSINMAYVDERGLWHGMGSMSGVKAWMPLPDAYEE